MKSIITIFIVGLFAILSGCDKNNNEAVIVHTPEMEIQFVNNEGKILHFDKDGGISFLDYEIYSNGNISDENFLEKCPLEVLSITDENGIPVKYKLNYAVGLWFRFRFVNYQERKKEDIYIIKYKIPLITGESVEELRGTLKKNENGHPDGWYNCQYNGKNIRVYTLEELYPDYYNPHRVIDKEEDSRRVREMLYNGDLVGADGVSGISFSLPVDIVP